jgi:hypothetical protein
MGPSPIVKFAVSTVEMLQNTVLTNLIEVGVRKKREAIEFEFVS